LKYLCDLIAFREALREAMNEEMRRDERVLLMGKESQNTMVHIR
jgi:pyruvate/2-oxoglutarate/acetoin dehydrogenase E1 component